MNNYLRESTFLNKNSICRHLVEILKVLDLRINKFLLIINARLVVLLIHHQLCKLFFMPRL